MSGSKSSDMSAEVVAGNGLLHRRVFLTHGAALMGVGGLNTISPGCAAGQEAPPDVLPWMRAPGAGLSGYGNPSRYEDQVQRTVSPIDGLPSNGSSYTPLERLNGIITPSGLHHERHHSGIPDINPDDHRLLVHGLVKRPLIFDLGALSRYPMVSRIQFLECAGNSAASRRDQPPAGFCGEIHGRISCSEWTGVPLGILLEEAGADPEAQWLLAEGSDSGAMGRSVPMAKAMDDAIVALYQNGERIRPSQGYPVRLFLPGYEGNACVKWLRRIKVTAEPTMTKHETASYTDLLPSGEALQFTLLMRVKSVITAPSPGLSLAGPGLYEISGLAWSGTGKIAKVEVSADGSQSWGEAALSEPVHSKALTRFRMAWRWDGGPAILKSRATDETGETQPTREERLAQVGPIATQHFNAVQAWSVGPNNEVSNIHV